MGERFKQILKRLGFSNNSFAKELKITEGTVRNIINNKGNSISPAILTYLFQRGYNINWLLTGEGEMFLEDDEDDDDGSQYIDIGKDSHGIIVQNNKGNFTLHVYTTKRSASSKKKKADSISLEGLTAKQKEFVINLVNSYKEK